MHKYDDNFYDNSIPPGSFYGDDHVVDPLNVPYPLDLDPYVNFDDFNLQFLLWETDKNSLKRRSFIFHPSFLDGYTILKQEDPNKATEYIELLMDYGVYGIEGTTDCDHIRLALYGKFPTIEKSCQRYREEHDAREKRKQRIYSEQRDHDTEKVSKGFFCYEDYLRMAKECLPPEKYTEFLYALTETGCCHKYEGTDPDITLLLSQIIPNMNATDLRYKRSISNGRKGGRKKLFSDDALIEAITVYDLKTQKELAEHFGCDIRTIARRVKTDKVKEYYDARKNRLSYTTDTPCLP